MPYSMNRGHFVFNRDIIISLEASLPTFPKMLLNDLYKLCFELSNEHLKYLELTK